MPRFYGACAILRNKLHTELHTKSARLIRRDDTLKAREKANAVPTTVGSVTGDA